MTEMLETGPPQKSRLAAGCLSIFPGVGQMYNGQVRKGAIILVLWLGTTAAFGISVPVAVLGLSAQSDTVASLGGLLSLVLICLWPIIYILAILDAVVIAGRVSRGEEVRPYQFF